jgi:excisionase family DNA binding protein
LGAEEDSMNARIAPKLELAELPPTLTVKRAGELLGLSRSAAYRAAAAGELPTLAFGRRLVVPTFRLLEMLGLTIQGRR